jgi:hypothetical protein
MSDEELVEAWDLWFDLAQTTNQSDAPYSHGVFARLRHDPAEVSDGATPQSPKTSKHRRTPGQPAG